MSGAKGKKTRRRKAITPETRKRMSEAHKRRWKDPKHREKVIKAIREGVASKRKRLRSAGMKQFDWSI